MGSQDIGADADAASRHRTECHSALEKIFNATSNPATNQDKLEVEIKIFQALMQD